MSRLSGSNASQGLITTPSGLKYEILKAGTGKVPKAGQQVDTDYTGWLNKFDGKKFDSSLDRGDVFRFTAGGGQVIKGWDEAILGMREGETRNIVLPPHLAYGAAGAGGVIPPNATLYFTMTLHKVN